MRLASQVTVGYVGEGVIGKLVGSRSLLVNAFSNSIMQLSAGEFIR